MNEDMHDIAIGSEAERGDVMAQLAPVLEDLGKTDQAELELTSEIDNETDADSGFSGDVLSPMDEEDILHAVKKEIQWYQLTPLKILLIQYL